jgi:AcrR family transcriptional regulator
MSTAPAAVHAPRWQRRPDRRPEEILDAALRVFVQRGLHKAKLEEVAQEAGISKGTIYLYFKNKEELFVATAHRVMASIEELDIEQYLAPSVTKDARLPHLLRQVAQTAYRHFCTPSYLAFFSMLAAEARRYPEWGELYFRRVLLEVNHRLAAVFEHAMRTGECRTVDPVLAARAFAGMFLIMALSQEHLGGKKHTPLSERKVIDSLTDIFLHGILPVRS